MMRTRYICRQCGRVIAVTPSKKLGVLAEYGKHKERSKLYAHTLPYAKFERHAIRCSKFDPDNDDTWIKEDID